MSVGRKTWASALPLGLIVVCLIGEAAVLNVGIDDLDEGYFVQQAVRVLHGQIPYRDFQTLYSPGLAYAHAALFALAGGPFLLAPRALALAARAGLALLLFWMTRPLVRRPLWAALPGVFLLVGLDDAPVLWEPHPGWLSTLFGVLAAWCLSHQPRARWLATAGAAAAVAYAFKQNTGVFILAAIVLREGTRLGLAYPSPRPSPRGRGGPHNVLEGLLPFSVFAVVTALWLGPLLIALRGDITHLGVLIGAVNQAGLFAGPEWPILVPLACLAGGLWVGRRQDADPRLRWYLLAGSALFLTQYPRMDALHLAWSAPLLLIAGAVSLDRLPSVVASLAVVGAFALTAPTLTSRLAVVDQRSVPIQDLRFAAGIRVPEPTRADLQDVVAEIQRRTQPNEPIFVYPTSPLLYALAERPNPTRYDHLNPGAADAREIQQIMRDLDAAGVRLVVVSDFWEAAWGDPGPNAPLAAWLATRFSEVARYGAYRVLTAGL